MDRTNGPCRRTRRDTAPSTSSRRRRTGDSRHSRRVARRLPKVAKPRKVGDLYSSFLDEERINARGVRPLIDRLAQVEALASINELLALIGRLQRRGVGGFYAIFVDNDPGDPERYVTMPGTGRPFAPRRELLPRRALRSDSRSLRGARGTNARIRWPELTPPRGATHL